MNNTKCITMATSNHTNISGDTQPCGGCRKRHVRPSTVAAAPRTTRSSPCSRHLKLKCLISALGVAAVSLTPCYTTIPTVSANGVSSLPVRERGGDAASFLRSSGIGIKLDGVSSGRESPHQQHELMVRKLQEDTDDHDHAHDDEDHDGELHEEESEEVIEALETSEEVIEALETLNLSQGQGGISNTISVGPISVSTQGITGEEEVEETEDEHLHDDHEDEDEHLHDEDNHGKIMLHITNCNIVLTWIAIL
jgi:hypothetical protein